MSRGKAELGTYFVSDQFSLGAFSPVSPFTLEARNHRFKAETLASTIALFGLLHPAARGRL